MTRSDHHKVSPDFLGPQRIQGGPKNWHTFVRFITSSKIDQFSNFFDCQNQEKICSSTIAKDSIATQVCRYNILFEILVS